MRLAFESRVYAGHCTGGATGLFGSPDVAKLAQYVTSADPSQYSSGLIWYAVSPHSAFFTLKTYGISHAW